MTIPNHIESCKKSNQHYNQAVKQKVVNWFLYFLILKINLFLPPRLRAMEEGSEVVEDIVFRGVEFSVKIEVDKGLLIVEISDAMTADQWRGDFDPACK